MPFAQVTQLLELLDLWLHNGWEVELCCRCLFFLLRVHHHQLVSSSVLLPVMDSLRQHTAHQVTAVKVCFVYTQAHLTVSSLSLSFSPLHLRTCTA